LKFNGFSLRIQWNVLLTPNIGLILFILDFNEDVVLTLSFTSTFFVLDLNQDVVLI